MTDQSDQPQNKQGLDEARKTYQRTEKWTRRGGMIFLVGLAVAIIIPIAFAAYHGISEGQVKDPWTGQPVTADDSEMSCLEEAEDLVYLARADGEESTRWEERYRRWTARCQAEHSEVQRLLEHSRQRLEE